MLGLADCLRRDIEKARMDTELIRRDELARQRWNVDIHVLNDAIASTLGSWPQICDAAREARVRHRMSERNIWTLGLTPRYRTWREAWETYDPLTKADINGTLEISKARLDALAAFCRTRLLDNRPDMVIDGLQLELLFPYLDPREQPIERLEDMHPGDQIDMQEVMDLAEQFAPAGSLAAQFAQDQAEDTVFENPQARVIRQTRRANQATNLLDRPDRRLDI